MGHVALFSIEAIMASLLFAIAGQILLKLAMGTVGPIVVSRERLPGILRSMLSQPRLYAGFICNGLSAIVWLYVLSRVELSYAYPFQAASVVLITIGARIVLDEQVSLARWGAILLIAAGLACVSMS